jgi:hypothetical protein
MIVRWIPVVAAVTVAPLLVGVACSPFGTGDDPPSLAPPKADAAVDGAQAPSPDAGLADSGPVTTTTGCAARSGALFCDDFEHLGLTDNGWSSHVSGGSLEVSDSRSLSPVHALLVKAGGGIGGNAYVARNVSLGAGKQITVRTQVFFESPPMGDYLSVLGVSTAHGYVQAFIQDGTCILSVDDDNNGVTPASTASLQPPPVGVWFELAIQLDFAAGETGTATLVVDRAESTSLGGITTAADGMPSSVAVNVGVVNGSVTNPATTFFFDDFSVDP